MANWKRKDDTHFHRIVKEDREEQFDVVELLRSQVRLKEEAKRIKAEQAFVKDQLEIAKSLGFNTKLKDYEPE